MTSRHPQRRPWPRAHPCPGYFIIAQARPTSMQGLRTHRNGRWEIVHTRDEPSFVIAAIVEQVLHGLSLYQRLRPRGTPPPSSPMDAALPLPLRLRPPCPITGANVPILLPLQPQHPAHRSAVQATSTVQAQQEVIGQLRIQCCIYVLSDPDRESSIDDGISSIRHP